MPAEEPSRVFCRAREILELPADGAVGGIETERFAGFRVPEFQKARVGERLFPRVLDLQRDQIMPFGRDGQKLFIDLVKIRKRKTTALCLTTRLR